MENIKKSNPLFSVIIPCYNVENYIARTINSVLDQTFNDFEIILVNDGSVDNTGKILDEYLKKDTRIKVIHQKNKGVSEARNTGIREAKGEYIYFLDGDDIINENLLLKADEIFKTQEVSYISFGYKMIYEDGKLKKDYCNPNYNNQIFLSKEFLTLFFYKKINQHICSFIVEKNIIKKNFLKFNPQLIRGEDLDFQVRILLNNFNVFYISFPYFKYCMRKGSAVYKKVSSNIFEFLNTLEKNKKIFYDEGLIEEYNYYFIISFFYTIKEIADKGYENNNFFEVKNNLKKYENILNYIPYKEYKLIILKYMYKTNLIFIFFKMLKYFKKYGI